MRAFGLRRWAFSVRRSASQAAPIPSVASLTFVRCLLRTGAALLAEAAGPEVIAAVYARVLRR
jgi:hypothetical protein